MKKADNDGSDQVRRRTQYGLKSLLLLTIPGALVFAFAVYWFDDGPDYAKPSVIYELTAGNELESMFAKLVPNQFFGQTRCRGEGKEVTTRSGVWTRQFEAGLWSDRTVADRAMSLFQTDVQKLIRGRGGDYRDQQVRLDDSRMNGFRLIYVIDGHVGKLEAY